MLSFDIDAHHPDASFETIATSLFTEYVLVANQGTYLLTEIEFYYHDMEYHPDVYTHGHSAQAFNGRWYVHWSGIDITIGNEKSGKGGILLRGIKRRSEKRPVRWEYISGPLNVQRELLSGGSSVFSEAGIPLRLVESNPHREWSTIYKSSRIGLNKNKAGGATYCEKAYRFIIDWEAAHRFAKKEGLTYTKIENSKTPSLL